MSRLNRIYREHTFQMTSLAMVGRSMHAPPPREAIQDCTPVEERNEYMAALEEASVGQNIVPFAAFLARLVDDGIKDP